MLARSKTLLAELQQPKAAERKPRAPRHSASGERVSNGKRILPSRRSITTSSSPPCWSPDF
jgi:hypothetical protein